MYEPLYPIQKAEAARTSALSTSRNDTAVALELSNKNAAEALQVGKRVIEGAKERQRARGGLSGRL